MTGVNFNAMDYVASKIPDNAFENSLLIACQHLLPTVENLLKALFEKGLAPEDVYIIGKCYSTNETTIKNLHNMNVNVHTSTNFFDSYKPYEEDFKNHISHFINEISVDLKKYKNIMVLDDGGDLHLAVHEYFKDIANVSGVEQTTRGYAKLYKHTIKYPVVNVARSQSKLELESPLVAEAVVKGLNRQLEEIPYLIEKILIVGNGSVGSALYKTLSNHYEIICYDVDQRLSDFQEYQAKSLAPEIDMILGCSGNNILPFLERNNFLNKKVVLASCSSTDVEFGYEKLRLQNRRLTYCHKNINANGIYLLNCGFPVNFQGGNECSIPPSKFHITNALLFFGLYQSIQEKSKSVGLVKLKEEIQKFLCGQYSAKEPVSIVRNQDCYYPYLQ